MIRVFVEQDGKLRTGDASLAALDRPRWVDIEAQTPEEIAWLGSSFGFHPLALEDCLHLDQRPKLEEYPNSIFVVIHSFSATPAHPTSIERHELHAFLGKDLLVTVHADPLPAIDRVRTLLEGDATLLSRGTDLLLYLICDKVVDGHLPVLDAIHDAIEDLEERVLTGDGAPRELLQQILDFRRTLVDLRRRVAPTREVFVSLARPEFGRVSERAAFYFRDVQDHLQRTTDSIDAGRELLAGVLDGYRSQVANRTTDLMKRLTLFSALLLPLTLITGFFGMNFTGIPYDRPPTLHAAIAAMILLPAATVALFRFLRWI